ncbi:hypothetical protein C8F04DRAFT_1001670 [Mycena alexandri]|uniref:F-box domain-containing protein n=1 Tax=Mycena alexandri TaxID=1745969 RepID=A0AAD6SYT3_9AGAR|nr:hypothetical protein C8F04DRAFT_1001670 [Mycena alexandri]
MSSPLSIIDFPSEITSVIFLHCVEGEVNDWGDQKLPGLFEDAAPLLLLRICRQWRTVALSTPELWTSIQVHCPYDIEAIVPRLDRWLLRAGSLPLNINLHYLTYPETSSEGILQLLKRHSGQLQTLTLDTLPQEYFRIHEIAGPLPALKTIFLTCRGFSDYARFCGMKLNAFSDAPVLRDVQFLGHFHPATIALPWAQLTNFNANYLSISECLQVLSLSPNLVIARFDYSRTAGSRTVGSHHAVPPLLHLESLTLRGMEPSGDILRHLTTPALIHLDVEEVDVETWKAFIARSGCVLERLSFAGWTSSYKEYLDGVPSVTELKVRRLGRGFSEIVQVLGSELDFLPNLKTFNEDPCGSVKKLEKGAELARLLVDMLETRYNSPQTARLERFEYCMTEGLMGSAGLLERIQVLVADGMTVYIRGSKSWV